ncbi:UPF0158 family protein [Nocardioides limicola]|uniref:UPF0158 family protein n=1 Tax=Nocardioides limicola TaxID=2803368 RepID=UPI00193C24AC|nr:UPF0158 family protein [Nocardioides sp. DJM-14]
MLDPRQIDLTELGELLDQPEWNAGYFDPATGEVIQALDGEVYGPQGEPIDGDEMGWIVVGGEGSRSAYRDMEAFAEAVADPRLADRMADALQGRGAFKRFRSVVHDHPSSIGEQWNNYRRSRQTIRALDWLLDDGVITESSAAPLRAEAIRIGDDALASVSSPVADGDIKEVMRLERHLQTPACRQDPAGLRALLADDFIEIGASGRTWDPESIIAHVRAEKPADEIEIAEMTARALAADLVLVQWTSQRAGRRARRTSMWRRDPGGWRLVHHQGTPLP